MPLQYHLVAEEVLAALAEGLDQRDAGLLPLSEPSPGEFAREAERSYERARAHRDVPKVGR
jgi:hypothetical protein